ncbi:PEP-CTERM sorting domain-containing protein [Desulfobacter curvatus]|uniref:PEP-CTERM sorting domain-containing protein n=1 Tax=Desulfobacter curvatus TaxID=2290 RepID=UPI00035E9666|nr:PEP-CTERM sorting domain-containing protein [Desulfobacter curvatus]
MKKFLVLFTLLLSTAFMASNVYAFSYLLKTGDYIADGAVYDIDGNVDTTNQADPIWGSQNLSPAGTYVPADGTADAYAVGLISQWDDTNTAEPWDIFWDQNEDYEITFEVTGADDVLWSITEGAAGEFTAELYSVGVTLNIYLDTTPDYDYLGGGATDGILLLSLAGHDLTGTDINDVDFTYDMKSTYEFATNTYDGDVLFDVVGGLWAAAYDTNEMTGGADMELSYELSDNLDPLNPMLWDLSGHASGIGAAVPEPTTMLLFGVGLIGMASIGRRKNS